MREFLFKYNPNFDEGLNLKNSHFKSYFNRIIPIKKKIENKIGLEIEKYKIG